MASVTAALVFAVDTGERLVTIPSTAEGSPEQSFGVYARRAVEIHDARPRIASCSLDREGFALARHETTVTDFHDPDQRRDRYDGELAALIRTATGGARVFVFDHTLRAGDPAVRSDRKMREPVQRAHNDYTPRSGPRRVRDWFPADEADALLRGRFAIINTWRSIRGPVLTAPLAVCDARTVAPADLLVSERRAPARIGYTYRLVHNPAQRWYYVPRMAPGEVLLIKSYDSREDGVARFTPHAAFDDPSAPPGAPPRQSIESRAFVFY